MSAVHGCMCSLTDKISIDESAQLRGTEGLGVREQFDKRFKLIRDIYVLTKGSSKPFLIFQLLSSSLN